MLDAVIRSASTPRGRVAHRSPLHQPKHQQLISQTSKVRASQVGARGASMLLIPTGMHNRVEPTSRTRSRRPTLCQCRWHRPPCKQHACVCMGAHTMLVRGCACAHLPACVCPWSRASVSRRCTSHVAVDMPLICQAETRGHRGTFYGSVCPRSCTCGCTLI